MKNKMHIVLVEPRIPANTGNLIRLTANMGASLHLIHPLGFNLEDAKLRRAGLDYSDLSDVYEYQEFDAYVSSNPDRRLIFFSAKGNVLYSECSYTDYDSLIFGSEDTGLNNELLQKHEDAIKSYIPMMPHNRSINLSNAVAVVAFEAWRQMGFNHAEYSPRNTRFS